MSRLTERKAKKYLKNDFENDNFRFYDKQPDERGFDIWMENIKTGEKTMVELKASEGEYKKPSDIFQKLYFSAENEVENFEKGETKVLRVFMGNNPPRIFIFDRSVLNGGACFKKEFRAKIVGLKNYDTLVEIQ